MTTEIAFEERYGGLVESGVLPMETFLAARLASVARGVELESLLMREYGVPRRAMLEALSARYRLPFIEYDERLPVAPLLLERVDGERLSMSRWFPVILDGDTVVIAANEPGDAAMREEAAGYFGEFRLEFRVALGEDIQWFIQDFLHAKPKFLIGTERTGYAFWRNTMAQWRTRMACYRNDMAACRTDLGYLRWGLGMIAISDALIRMRKAGEPLRALHLFPLLTGMALAVFGAIGYLKIRKSRLTPPGHFTMVEVTAATMQFLENYHFIDDQMPRVIPSKRTMLARLGDFLGNHCTILYPSPASRERTHLARERNVLAAQRTIAACYRSIYARARTGLAFIRTGVSFASLGIGFAHYFGRSLFSLLDALIIAAGVLLAMDGLLWYLPVRNEQAEAPGRPAAEYVP